MYLKLRSDGRAVYKMEIMKRSKLFNTDSATVLPCTAFLTIIHYVVAYSRSFNEKYSVPFQESRFVESQKHLKPVKFIPPVSASTYYRHIPVARFCLDNEDPILFAGELNKI